MTGTLERGRLDAEHWVHVAGMVLTTVLVLCTFWTALAGLVGGLLVVALFPGALAALAGWLTSAWRRERPWSWWVWTVLATLSFLFDLAAPGRPTTGSAGRARRQRWPPAPPGPPRQPHPHPAAGADVDLPAVNRRPDTTGRRHAVGRWSR